MELYLKDTSYTVRQCSNKKVNGFKGIGSLSGLKNWIHFFFFKFSYICLINHTIIMNGNRASGLKKGYSGPSLHGSNCSDQKGIATKGDFRQASHTMQKMLPRLYQYQSSASFSTGLGFFG